MLRTSIARSVASLIALAALQLGAANSLAGVLFVVSRTLDSVYRYQVDESSAPTLDRTLSANLNAPSGVTVSPWRELFVTNFGSSRPSGFVARFTDAEGMATPNGTIPGNPGDPGFAFSAPYDGAFRGNELFVSNFDGKVMRFLFDGAGNAVSNGVISDHFGDHNGGVRGLAISPDGDLFVANTPRSGNSFILQWTFDAAGAAQFVREIDVGPGVGLHGIAFSPWGELFAVSPDQASILRYTFDALGNPISNGSISGNDMNVPLGLAFSPWGELFVGNNGAATVSRFEFDEAHVYSANGTFAVPTLTGNLAFAPAATAAVPEPGMLVQLGTGLATLLAAGGWRSRRRFQCGP